MHRLVSILLLLLCGSSVCRAEKRTIHGFVIEVISPTKFKIDDYDMSRDEQFSLDFNEIAPQNILNALKRENIRVGTEIEIKGDDNRSTHQLTVKSVHVFPTSPHQFNSTALLEKLPELKKTASGWSGYIFTDGERVQVTNSTVVTLRANKSELKKFKAQNKEWPGPESAPLASLNEINLDTMAHYEGFRQEDGSILASKVEFEHAEMEPGEAKLWERLIPEFKDADTLSSKPAELHILRSRYKIVPIQEAQDYIQKLGESLVPAHERERQPKDPLKISFRFYLVEDKSLEVLAYPNGIIIVKSELFDTLENEAQLAFFLSNAIAQVVERDIWRISQYQKDARILTSAGATLGWVPGIGALDAPFAVASIATGEMFNRYVDSLLDQANRVGLEWMLAAGYDLREAPRAYKAYVLKNPDQPEYSPTYDAYQADKNKQFAGLRSNLMAKLRTTYFQTDYDKLKKDSDAFHTVAQLVQQAEQDKKIPIGTVARDIPK